jgi:hypothetical protein
MFVGTQAGVNAKTHGYRSAVDDLLEVDLPADTPSLRVARLMLWEAAARAGLDCDSADDLCLAFDEVCFAIFVRVGADDRLALRIHGSSGVHVDGHVRTESCPARVELSALARTLVALAVEDFELDERADGVHFTMTKRSPVLEMR